MKARLRTLLGALAVAAFLCALVGGPIFIGWWNEKPPPVPYRDVRLLADAHFVTSRGWYHASVFKLETYAQFQKRPLALRWLRDGASGIELVAASPAALAGNRPVVILIHGYNAPESRIASYFAPFLGFLRDQPGFDADVVVYDWPSTARHWEELSSDERRGFSDPGVDRPGKVRDPYAGLRWEKIAYTSDVAAARTAGAAGLLELLRQVTATAPRRRISIVAHSMGSLVALEALRTAGAERPALQRPALHRVVLLAPDVDARMLSDPDLQAAIASTPEIHVFYSRNDDVLLYSRIANIGPRLGRDGHQAGPPLLPNVVMHDVTEILGTGEAVHSRYLDPELARKLPIARAMQ